MGTFGVRRSAFGVHPREPQATPLQSPYLTCPLFWRSLKKYRLEAYATLDAKSE
jgi:hypothetical protein